jgi:hypothetical protein
LNKCWETLLQLGSATNPNQRCVSATLAIGMREAMNQFNKSDFIQEWINRDEYYRIGYDKSSKQNIIAITITWICWYEIFFKLTNEEFEWHKTQIEKLNDLAHRMAVDKGNMFYKDRLLLFEGPT